VSVGRATGEFRVSYDIRVVFMIRRRTLLRNKLSGGSEGEKRTITNSKVNQRWTLESTTNVTAFSKLSRSRKSALPAERQIIAVVDGKKSLDDTKRSEKKSELETEFRNSILSLERLNISRSRRAPWSSLDPDGCTDTSEWESKLDVRRKRF